MSVQILSLNAGQVPACAAAQEKILALLPDKEAELKRCDTAKQLFYTLSETLKSAQTILLLVEPGRYLYAKEQLMRAMGLSASQSPEILAAAQQKGVSLPDGELARHAAIPDQASAFPTEDGLFSGFMLTAGRQTILFLPLDNRRIDGILQAEAGVFLDRLQGACGQQPEPEEENHAARAEKAQGPLVEEEDLTEQEPVPESRKTAREAAALAIEALNASGTSVAFAATPTAEFLQEASEGVPNAAQRIIYSSAFHERGEEPAKQYAAELARQAMLEAGATFGAALTNVYTVKQEGREETFLLLAVADENGAQVRLLYAQPEEHPGLLIDDGVRALYEMVGQKARAYGREPLEEQERPAHWKAFAAVLSVLLTLSALLCLGTGLFLRGGEAGAQEAVLSAVNAAAVQQTQPETQPDAAQVTRQDSTVPQDTAPVPDGTAPSTEEPAAEDQALLDEVAQAMEEELQAGGRGETEQAAETEKPERPSATSPDGTQEDGNGGTTQGTQPPETTTPPATRPASPSGMSGKFVFTVYGYGHGVGMSQFGANEFAKSGWDYQKILLHYFPGVTIQEKDSRYPATLEVDGKQVDTKVVLARIVEKEMGGSYQLEALKAQAVAAYTYILRQNRVTGVAIGSTYSARAMQAVEAVLGEYMTYNGTPILATFFACSAGKTADVRTVWGGSGYPYLQGGCTSPGDKNHASYQTTYTITSDALAARVKDALGITLTGDPSKWLKIKAHDTAVSSSVGYVSSIQVGSKTISGQAFRADVMGYDIRSHCFTVTYIPD